MQISKIRCKGSKFKFYDYQSNPKSGNLGDKWANHRLLRSNQSFEFDLCNRKNAFLGKQFNCSKTQSIILLTMSDIQPNGGIRIRFVAISFIFM